jgi:LAGLIDADG endonuclease
MEIIKIFSLYPLQSIKFLNFIKFKEAFELYISSSGADGREDLYQKINEYRSSMNRGITDYLMPEGKVYQITPHWLLGFIEGEASFAVIKTKLRLVFNIAQSGVDYALLEAIRDYFHSFKGVNLGRYADNLVAIISIYNKPPLANPEVKINKPEGKLYIYNLDFFKDHLIPLLDSLTWHTKKAKDYQDFKSILKLKSMGLHHSEEGVRVINLILSQMNSKRLSTNDLDRVERALLNTQIEKLLNGPSNFEIKEDGRVYIISLNKYLTGGTRKPLLLTLKDPNGSVISTFRTRSECAKFLGVSANTVTSRMQEGKVFLFKGQCVSLSKGVQD